MNVLLKFRVDNCLRQRDIALRLNKIIQRKGIISHIKKQHVSNWERGLNLTRNPDVIYAICELTDISVDKFRESLR